MSATPDTNPGKFLSIAVVHLLILFAVALVVVALANWESINDAVVYIITVDGNFWAAAVIAAAAGTLPVALVITTGEENARTFVLSTIVCIAFTRGAWLVEPYFSGTALQDWTFGALVVICVISLAMSVSARGILEASD